MKENIEIYCDGTIAQIDDFAKYQFFGKQANKSKISQDKGHEQELVEFCKAISEGKPSPISFEELYHSSLVTFKAIEAMQRGQTLAINHSF
jgi:polar amino acid transport system substrate-binding protein